VVRLVGNETRVLGLTPPGFTGSLSDCVEVARMLLELGGQKRHRPFGEIYFCTERNSTRRTMPRCQLWNAVVSSRIPSRATGQWALHGRNSTPAMPRSCWCRLTAACNLWPFKDD
jgi:hypothetical protein